MPENTIQIVYDGGDATGHAIELRLLGQSLQGIDRIISDGLIIASTGRMPKKGERAVVITKIQEPAIGSYTISGFWQEISTSLALGVPIITNIGTDIISHYVKSVLLLFSGRKLESDKALETVEKIMLAQIAANENMDARRHEEIMRMQSILAMSIERLGPAAAQCVAPIGRSVETASFAAGSHEPARIGVNEADAIRASNEIEWGPIGEIELRTDGFKFHTSGLSVEHPDREGYLMAKVSDPAFSQEENAYTEAAQRRSRIVVLARRGYRSGQLQQLDIVDFVREISS